MYRDKIGSDTFIEWETTVSLSNFYIVFRE